MPSEHAGPNRRSAIARSARNWVVSLPASAAAGGITVTVGTACATLGAAREARASAPSRARRIRVDAVDMALVHGDLTAPAAVVIGVSSRSLKKQNREYRHRWP